MTADESVEQRAWVNSDSGCEFEDAEGFDKGSADVSVGDLCTTGVPISVGSWSANNLVVSEPGEKPTTDARETVGNISRYTSYGIDYAGHRHPFVVTPGHCVYSASNSFMDDEFNDVIADQNFSNQFKGQTTPRSYRWVKSNGTSMATPIAGHPCRSWKTKCLQGNTLCAGTANSHQRTQSAPTGGSDFPHGRQPTLCRGCRGRNGGHTLQPVGSHRAPDAGGRRQHQSRRSAARCLCRTDRTIRLNTYPIIT